MPYCPKCDMEFIDGITVCSDCGGPLLESKEVADALKREYDQAPEEALVQIVSEEESDEFPKKAEPKSEVRAYISKRQHYEDIRSSISAFFMIGGIFLIFSALCWMGLIKLPLAPGPLMMFQIVLSAMGIGCLIVALVSKKSANQLIKAAEVEDARTKELITWFTNHYTAGQLDEVLLKEDSSLEDNDLYLKRFELIQDYLVTEYDLPDQNYVDFLCEDIYGKLFEPTH
ncbi:MAG: hypothetical protein RR225_08365 [Clostridium sp.]